LSENVRDIFNNLDKNLQKISVEQMEKLVTEMNSASTKSMFTDQSVRSPQSVNFPISGGLKNEVRNIQIPETGTTLDPTRMLSGGSKSEKELGSHDSASSSRGHNLVGRNRDRLNYESIEGISFAGRPNLTIERVGEVEIRHTRAKGTLSIVSESQNRRFVNEQESEEENVILNTVQPVPQEIKYRDEYEQAESTERIRRPPIASTLEKPELESSEGSRKVVYSHIKNANPLIGVAFGT